MREKKAVISTAVFMEVSLRFVMPMPMETWRMWVSSGIMSLEGETPFQTPGSTESLRTIQRRNRLTRLKELLSSVHGVSVGAQACVLKASMKR